MKEVSYPSMTLLSRPALCRESIALAELLAPSIAGAISRAHAINTDIALQFRRAVCRIQNTFLAGVAQFSPAVDFERTLL